MNVIGIIPVRGGSKGIPLKNIKPFCGKPLIAWSIEQAKNSQNINSLWVTSDNEEILDVAKQFGAKTVKRPSDISGDTATSESAWSHAIDVISGNESIDIVVGIQATSPIREAQDFDLAIDIFLTEKIDSLFTSTAFRDFFLWEYSSNHALISINYDWKNRKRRQDLPERFIENGSFYIFKPEIIKKFNNRLGGKIGTFTMENYKQFQIDNLEDFVFCETIMKAYILKSNI